MATTPRGIVTPDSGDPYNYIVDLATMADTIDDAIGDVDSSVSALVGDVSQIQSLMAYKRVIPTSVGGTGVTMSNGVVTISSSPFVSVNGCFSSAYVRYIIYAKFVTSGAAYPFLILRASGSNDTTSNYDLLRTRGTGSGVTDTVLSLASNSWAIAPVALANSIHTVTIELANPESAIPTTGKIEDLVTPNPMTTNAGTVISNVLHRSSTAFDGFTLAPTSGNITGSLRIVGVA